MLRNLLDALPFAAVSAFFAYEAISIVTGISPTISRILAYNLDTHTPITTFIWGVGAGAFLVLLALHIAGLLPFWRP